MTANLTDGKKYIGFDLGAESGRCVVALLENNIIKLHEVHRFTTHCIKLENGLHWDILAIYNELLIGLSNAQQKFGSEFDGVGIDTWAVDYALLSPEGKLLGYPYHYRDDRTDDIMEQAFKVVKKTILYEKTGIQFAQFNTLFQLLAEKINSVTMLNAADKMLLIPDYLSYLLSGVKKGEYTNASTTSLVDPFSRQWCWELIDAFNLPRRIFPELVEAGTSLGTLLPSIAEKTGLSKNIPVIASASHDTASAVASVPVSGEDWAFLSSGTWSLMGIETEQPFLSPEAMEANYTNEGGVNNTVRFLKNIIGLWPIQECRRFWLEKSADYSYPALVALARENGPAGSWVDLNDKRFLKAGEMPGKIMSYLSETGQTVKPDAGFLVRVILESLAFSYKKTIDEIEQISGKKIKVLHAVGGGIQNELLTQLTADAIGRRVFAGPTEGTIIGNFGVQAIATGAVTDIQAWRKMVGKSFEVKVYEPANSQYFLNNEQKYLSILG